MDAARSPVRRPALAPALGFIAGIALGALPPPTAWWLPATLALLGLPERRRRWGRPLGAIVLAGSVGVAVGTVHPGRPPALSPPDGSPPRELAIEGHLTAPVDVDAEGETRLTLFGRPRGSARESAGRVELSVRGGSEATVQRLRSSRRGDRLVVWARVSRPDAGSGAWRRGARWTGTVKSARLIEWSAEPPTGSPARAIDGLKLALRERLSEVEGFSTDGRALAGAILLGDRGGLSPGTIDRLRGAGLIHLVAISGLHVGWIGLALIRALERTRVPRSAVLVLAVALLAGFSVLVGTRPSVLRAVLACAIALAGRRIGRDGDALNTLAWLAAVLVALHPADLLDPGFQLTFLATAAILLGAGGWARALPLPRVLASAPAVSLAAYAGTAGAAAFHFGRLAPIAPLSNLLGVPLCGLLLACGYLAFALDLLALPGSPPLWWLARAAVEGLLRGSASVVDVVGPGVVVPAPSGAWLALAPLAAVLAWHPSVRQAGVRSAVRRQLPWLALLAALHLGPVPERGPVRYRLLDVGQGQSLLVSGGDHGAWLIDAAGHRRAAWDPGERIVVPAARRVAPRVAVLAISHADVDHAGGAFAVLRDLEVGELWLGPGHVHRPRLAALAEAARQRGTAVVLRAAGDRAGGPAGVAVEVLAPERDDRRLDGNDRSLVLRFGGPPCRVLLPGDVELAGEAALLEHRGDDLRADVMVAPHHGSRGSGNPELLRRVAPRWVVVSAGRRNRYGHPDAEFLERLRRRAIPWRRTDVDGEIVWRAGGDRPCEPTGVR